MTTSPPETSDAIRDRIKLPLTFDVPKMQAEVRALGLDQYIYYGAQLRSVPLNLKVLNNHIPPTG